MTDESEEQSKEKAPSPANDAEKGNSSEKKEDEGNEDQDGRKDVAFSPAPSPERRKPPSPTWSASLSAVTASRTASSAVADVYYRPPRNAALVLLSPRFDTPDARDLVRSTLLRKLVGGNVRIAVDRSISAERMSRLKLVDYRYGVAARLAMEVEPSELRKVDEVEFEKAFNEKWSDALSSNNISNALRALTRLGCDPKRLGEVWREAEDRTPKSGVVRLGPDLLCGLLSVGETSLYVLNGFYPAVRGQFISPGAAVHAFGVEWDPTHSASWGSFRENICGCSSSSKSASGAAGWPKRQHPLSEASTSLRHILWERRAELSIDPQHHENNTDREGVAPDDGYDGWDDLIYVAPSPLEALADRCAWLLGGDPRDGTSSSPSDDAPYGRVLLGRGLPERKLLEWFENPVVTVPPPPPPSYSDGTPTNKRVFDVVRGTDAAECTKKLLEIYDNELSSLEKVGAGCSCVIA